MVSIITITHNRGYLIGETILSVLDQTYADFEYIIIDDDSEDDTEEIVKGFKDQRIRYYKLPRIGRLGKLRNVGINKANGEYIAFIDSDDIWESNKLEIQVNIMETTPSLGFCFCDVLIFRGSQIITDNIYDSIRGNRSLYTGNLFKRYIYNRLPIYSSSTVLFKKSCYENVGPLDENMKSGDHDFICRLLYYYDGCILFQSLAKIRRHESNHSDYSNIQPFEEYIETLKRFYRKKMISWNICQKMISSNYYQAGRVLLKKEEYKIAGKIFLKSFFTNPLNYKGITFFFITLCKSIKINKN